LTRSAAPYRRRTLAGLAAAVAATLAILVWGPGLLLSLQADYATGIAGTRIVALEDGSSVTLGADSAIAVDFVADRRAVRLLKGEAFFDVAPDPERPFSVAARQTTTTVYGTAFDVRSLPDSIAVSVEHGRVGVEWATGDAIVASDTLGADDWAEFGNDGQLAAGKLLPGSVAGWRSGKLILQDRPMSDAVGRNFHGSVIVTDRSLLADRITGVFDLTSPEEALVAALHVHGGQVVKISPWLLLVTRN
jgi:transmembrane sensor